MLTGEADNASKTADMLPDDLPLSLVNQDKRNMVFAGTLVTRGLARGVSVSV